MDEKERIQKDIILFKINIKKIKKERSDSKPVVLARQYSEDAQYYSDKKDYFTAFGCINYAHGLLDAINFLTKNL